METDFENILGLFCVIWMDGGMPLVITSCNLGQFGDFEETHIGVGCIPLHFLTVKKLLFSIANKMLCVVRK